MEYFIILGLIGIFLILLILYYNRFISLKNKVKEAWSSIDIQLKRRYDLIPNLLETVKGYAEHEKEILIEISKVRSVGIEANGVQTQAKAENQISNALGKLFAVVENYPDLKANQNFIEFQNDLSEIEDKIQMSRRYYNAIVRDNNIAIEKFPGVLFAKIFNFTAFDYFEIQETHRENVKISFD